MTAFDPIPGEVRGPHREIFATVPSCEWKAELFTRRGVWVQFHADNPQDAVQAAKDAFNAKHREGSYPQPQG